MRSGPWSPEENSLLESLLDEGHTIAECARRLGRTKCSVERRMDVAGLSSRNGHPAITVPTLRRIRQLASYGMTSDMIGAVIGKPKSTIDGIRCRHGVKRPALPCVVSTKVTRRCWDSLIAAAKRIGGGASPLRVAGVTLELATAGQMELIGAITAPPPVVIRPGELKAIVGLQPELQARM
jgi:hypothetical protein